MSRSTAATLIAVCTLAACTRPPKSSASELDRMDQFSLALLADAGTDMSRSVEIDHYLYVPRREDAASVVDALDHKGYQAKLREPLGKLSDGRFDSRWSVVASIQEAPTLESLRKERAVFDALAKQYRGEYDGWEAAVPQSR